MKKRRLTAIEMVQVGRRIRAFIYAKRLTQENFAEMVGITQPALNCILKGTVCPLWVVYRIVNEEKYFRWKEYLLHGRQKDLPQG